MNTNLVVFSMAHMVIQAKARRPHRYPAKFFQHYSPYLFGTKLFSMQDKLVNNKQTYFLKQNFSAPITPIDKTSEMLINL